MIYLKTPNRITDIVQSGIKCVNCSLIDQCSKYYRWSGSTICRKFFFGYINVKVRRL